MRKKNSKHYSSFPRKRESNLLDFFSLDSRFRGNDDVISWATFHNNSFKIRKRYFGVSLLEILIALAVLAIGFTALFKLQMVLIAHHHRFEQQTYARLLAENKLIEFYQQIPTNVLVGVQTIKHDHIDYQVQWHIEENPSTNYVIASVNITWKASQQNAQQFHLEMLLAPSDPLLSQALLEPQEIKY